MNLLHPDEFFAAGTLIREAPKGRISGFSAAELERRLHGLCVAGTALAATAVPEPEASAGTITEPAVG
ncbi:hypothetical protein [Actinoplanes sp. NPDC020271]|uniref:hypothetical protein n=1 Tax=Actinoplanes sp. NPDC020271 TaxID=3363896 RepID=UPI0037B6F439